MWTYVIFHLFIGSTLMGVGVIAALVAGYGTLIPILIASAVGFLAAFPITYFVVKAVRAE